MKWTKIQSIPYKYFTPGNTSTHEKLQDKHTINLVPDDIQSEFESTKFKQCLFSTRCYLDYVCKIFSIFIQL